jgi:hypothetical protein
LLGSFRWIAATFRAARMFAIQSSSLQKDTTFALSHGFGRFKQAEAPA